MGDPARLRRISCVCGTGSAHADSQRRKAMKKKTKIMMIILAVICGAGVVAASLYMAFLLGRVQRPERMGQADTVGDSGTLVSSSSGMGEPDDATIGGVKNILLVGQDRRSGEKGRTRSDTMIICTIRPDTHEITMTSLMRDMYVPIPGYSSNRINAAYAYGGMELLDAVIEQDFGIRVDGNVEVDFDGFLQAAAKIAPVTMDLSKEEAEYMTKHPLDGVDLESQDGGWEFTEGQNDLYAGAMLEYARMRHVGNSDYERTERQRKLLRASFDKLKSEGVVRQLQFVQDVLPLVTTDLSNSDLLYYAKALVAGKYSIANEGYRIPVDGSYTSQSISGMSVLVPDLAKNAKALQEYIYGKVVSDNYKYVAKRTEKENTEESVRKNILYTEQHDALDASPASQSQEGPETQEIEATPTPTSAPAAEMPIPTPTMVPAPAVTDTPEPTPAAPTEDPGNGGTDGPVVTPEPTAAPNPTTEPVPTETPGDSGQAGTEQENG